MADEQAKNSANLGELFVEFGSKGMGGLIKGLNSVSASFLLTKNAGQQMLQPLANMSKQAGQGVVALDKLNSVTGISVKQLQGMKQWATLNNIDFSDYIGQVHSLQNALGRMALGDSGAIQGFAMLGLNPADFNPAKPLENMQKVKKAMLDMYKRGGEGAKYQISLAVQLLGLNEDLVYSFLNANKQVDKSLILTKKQIDELRDQNDAWVALKVAMDSFFSKSIANMDWLKTGTEKVTEVFKNLVQFVDANHEKKVTIIVDTIHKGWQNFKHFVGGFHIKDENGRLQEGNNQNFIMRASHKAANWIGDIADEELGRHGIKPLFNFGKNNAPMPKTLQSKNNAASTIMTNTDNRKAEVNINIEQTVTGENAQQSANDVINIMQENLYTQLGFNFIVNNNGGFNR